MLKSLTALLSTLALAATSIAQCPLPDHLDGGPCCSPAQITLPTFPAFKQSSLDICWKDCDVDNIAGGRVRWGKPQAGGTSPCGPMVSKVRMFDAAGSLTWRGKMRMQYSRTWFEVNTAGTDYQVWRFLVNGDLRPTAAAGGPPCPVPSCVLAFQRARYTGYVDWALDCATGVWSNAWMLTHACDGIDHSPGFPRGGAFHPDRSFTFVGPAAGFVVTPTTPAEGGASSFEATRRVRGISLPPFTVGVPICEYEEQIQHSLVPLAQFCFCVPGGTAQWQASDLFVAGACGTALQTGSGPVTGFNSMGIGGWTDPTKYPGQEVLRWNVGGYDVADACTGITQPEIHFGVTTIGGYQGHQILNTGIGAPLPPIYIDQNDSQRRSGGVQMNVPFYAGRVLNLNH
jgi:hypothetical protein